MYLHEIDYILYIYSFSRVSVLKPSISIIESYMDVYQAVQNSKKIEIPHISQPLYKAAPVSVGSALVVEKNQYKSRLSLLTAPVSQLEGRRQLSTKIRMTVGRLRIALLPLALLLVLVNLPASTSSPQPQVKTNLVQIDVKT